MGVGKVGKRIKDSLTALAKKPVILIADSNRADLGVLSQQLVKEGYDTLDAASLEELDERIRVSKKIALGLIDLSGFDERIWERCEVLRKARIPYIVISPQRSPLIQRDSMKHGANGLLVKPLGIRELLEHIYILTW
ncbi:response regulator [Chloroflexota bacterium]